MPDSFLRTSGESFPIDRLIILPIDTWKPLTRLDLRADSRLSLKITLGTRRSKLNDLCSLMMELAPESFVLAACHSTKLSFCLDIDCSENPL